MGHIPVTRHLCDVCRVTIMFQAWPLIPVRSENELASIESATQTGLLFRDQDAAIYGQRNPQSISRHGTQLSKRDCLSRPDPDMALSCPKGAA